MRPPVDSETYYVDAEMGDPLGSVKTLAIREHPRPSAREPELIPPGRKIGEMRITEVVNRIERLPLTAENRALLTAPWAQR